MGGRHAEGFFFGGHQTLGTLSRKMVYCCAVRAHAPGTVRALRIRRPSACMEIADGVATVTSKSLVTIASRIGRMYSLCPG